MELELPKIEPRTSRINQSTNLLLGKLTSAKHIGKLENIGGKELSPTCYGWKNAQCHFLGKEEVNAIRSKSYLV